MAAGKSIGEFSMKSTSLTFRPGPGGSTVIEGNFEGTGNLEGMGPGTVTGTGTFVGGKDGTSTYCGGGVSRQR